jgi:pimeloyl-ACP methyl ester carboxylesterase
VWRRIRGLLLVGALGFALSCSSPAGRDDPKGCGGELSGFSHRTVDTSKTKLHYVIGGNGPAVVLLHGFPETWWTWRHVMPRLMSSHTVIAPDLRGIGCSSQGPPPYDAQTLAGDLHDLMRSLGIPRTAVVGHDTGGWVAYAYAREYPTEVDHLALSGAAIPGLGLERLLDFREPGQGLPHLAFFAQPEVPELLIQGREKEFFERFIGSPVMKRSGAVDTYTRAYARPGRLTAALGQYRGIYQDARDNTAGDVRPLPMPTLAVTGEDEPNYSADSLRRAAAHTRDVAIPGAGHYVQEEKPNELADVLQRFLTAPP